MTDADHDLILAQIRDQLTTPLPIGTDHPPRQENPAMRDLLAEVEDVREVIRLVKGQRDRAEAAIARVKALHRLVDSVCGCGEGHGPRCDICQWADVDGYPCPTIRALEGADR